MNRSERKGTWTRAPSMKRSPMSVSGRSISLFSFGIRSILISSALRRRSEEQRGPEKQSLIFGAHLNSGRRFHLSVLLIFLDCIKDGRDTHCNDQRILFTTCSLTSISKLNLEHGLIKADSMYIITCISVHHGYKYM